MKDPGLILTRYAGLAILILLLFHAENLVAQPNIFRPKTQKTELIQFSKQNHRRWNTEKNKADSLARSLNIPIQYIDTTGRVILLQRTGRNKKPIYYATDNFSSAVTIAADQVWADTNPYPALTGAGTEINIWDGGIILSTHQELQSATGSKITMRESELALSDHSSHVAGTMVASGINPIAHGMASHANIKGWDLNDDIAEMANAAADGIRLSNHSYGPLCGWHFNTQNNNWYWYGDPSVSETEDYEFGFYNQNSADLDYIAELAPYYLIVKSAGNDRNDGPTDSFEHYVWDGAWTYVNIERDPDGGTAGFDCLTPMSVSKNILTVGAIDDSKNMTAFSAFGPTDDGRIKPDLVTNGYDVFSSVSASNTSYASYAGTSMAAASATGAIALLMQLQEIVQPGTPLLSSTIKGILIHTADEMGNNAGPDYSYGWGLLNIKSAADLIYTNSQNQGSNIYEAEISDGEEITLQVTTPADSPFLKATLCWTDPAAMPSSPALNNRNSKLVNDLDIQIEKNTSSEIFYPWTLDPSIPSAAPQQTTNHVDNTELVFINNPGANSYTVRISHSGSLTGSSQVFSLIISGINTQAGIFPPENLTYSLSESEVFLTWNSPSDANPDFYRIYRDDELLATSTTTSFSDLSIALDTHYAYFITAVYVIDNEEYESISTNQVNVYYQSLRTLPFTVDFENSPIELTYKNEISGWQPGTAETLNSYYLNFSDNTSIFIAADSYSAGDAIHVSDLAATPPLRLADYSDISLSFDYLLKTGIYGAIDELHIVYKTQDESNWHDLLALESSFNWKNFSVTLPDSICKNGTQIGFYYDDFYNWGMGAGLDNINISGTPPARYLDFEIAAIPTPSSACSLSESETIEITIKNVGEQIALAGDSLFLQLSCTYNNSTNELFILPVSLSPNESINYQFQQTVNLSSAAQYTLQVIANNSFDSNTSNNSLEKIITVYGFPQPNILNTDLSFCEDEQPILVEVSPLGGTLSGNGISGDSFYPAVAGAGTHTITYSLTDENGCEESTSVLFTVYPIPKPEILNTDLTFCEDEQPVVIEVSPSDGTLSGNGISGDYFYPEVAGAGTHTITYSLTDENGCEGSTTTAFTVYTIPQPAIRNTDLTFCENEQAILIEVSPSDGTLSGNGINGDYFYPAIAGAGTHSIFYSVTDENGCEGYTTATFTVYPIPQPEILNTDLSFCEDEQPVLIEVSPSGGTLSGNGISGDYFYPEVAGAGTHTITYSLTDENGCEGSTSVLFTVYPIPQPAILNTDLTFCEDEQPVLVVVSPSGGTLSGNGISGDYFYPAVAGAGTHSITYSVTDENGCEGYTTATFTVYPIPQPAILNTDLSFCEDEQSVLIEVSPSGGTLSGNGINGDYFYPAIAGAGTHSIFYSVTDENGCEGYTTATFTVYPIPQPEILNTDLSFCEDEQPVLIEVSPSGGTLSGNGINGDYFYPAVAGAGTHTIFYSVTDENGCEGYTTAKVTVYPIPQPAILNTDLIFCEDEQPILIEVSPSGGTLSGNGISGDYFYPEVAGAGTHTITYSVTDENGCEGSTTATFTVYPIPQPEILNTDLTFCENEQPVLIEVSPSDGTLSGNGISGEYFYPTVAGAGTHTITYSLTDENGCEGSTTTAFTVYTIPQPAILNTDLTFCEDEQPVLIEISPTGGTLFGNGISGDYFYPAAAGTGTHTISYSVTDDNGCEGSTSSLFTVYPIPQPEILNTDLAFCEDEQPVLVEVLPSGGTLSDNGISGDYFYPAVAGVGTHTIFYSVIDENGCEGSTSAVFTVYPIPQPEIQNTDLSFCEDEQPVLIDVSPTGGTLFGNGISGEYFYPAVAGSGTHTSFYSVIDENGCEGSTSAVFTVYPIPQPEILNTDLSFCEDEQPILIEVSPSGGTLAGNGISGDYFYPAEAGAGTHTITYSVTDENGCEGSISTEFTVYPIPQPEILNTDLSFCKDEQPVLIEVSPSGGTLSGNGISGDYFYPAVAGAGTHTISYSATDVNGCEGYTTATFTVYPIPQPAILNTDLIFCEDEQAILIEVSPLDGTLSGNGISGDYFYPEMAGAGTHTITYSITDENGCEGFTSAMFTVYPTPQPEILNTDLTFCEDEQPVLLEVSPSGGTLSGNGISGDYFSPAIAGAGTQTITYSVTDENGCEGSTTTVFSVYPMPQPKILSTDLSFCKDEQPVLIEVSPLGGTLSGNGISGDYFYPAVAGAGTHIISYSVTDKNGCEGYTTTTFTVYPMPQPEILNTDLTFCEEEQPVLVEVSPPGGTISGNGISGDYFYPAVAGAGTHTISYTMMNESNCETSIAKDFIVFKKLSIDLGPDQTIHTNDTLHLTPLSNSSSFIWYDNSLENELTLIADNLGVGTYSIWVIANENQYCQAIDTMLLTIDTAIYANTTTALTEILIYPNPFKEGFYIMMNDDEKIEKLLLFSDNGTTYFNVEPSSFPYFDASFLKPGIYFLHISTDKRESTFKLIKN